MAAAAGRAPRPFPTPWRRSRTEVGRRSRMVAARLRPGPISFQCRCLACRRRRGARRAATPLCCRPISTLLRRMIPARSCPTTGPAPATSSPRPGRRCRTCCRMTGRGAESALRRPRRAARSFRRCAAGPIAPRRQPGRNSCRPFGWRSLRGRDRAAARPLRRSGAAVAWPGPIGRPRAANGAGSASRAARLIYRRAGGAQRGVAIVRRCGATNGAGTRRRLQPLRPGIASCHPAGGGRPFRCVGRPGAAAIGRAAGVRRPRPF